MQPQNPHPSRNRRQAAHDLRNLFGIILSAKHGLDRDPEGAHRLTLLQAIEAAALRGGELTTGLLASNLASEDFETVDIADRLRGLTPLIQALANSRLKVTLDLHTYGLAARLLPADFDAVIVELAANASAAGARHLTVRSRCAGSRVWIILADDGTGMSPLLLHRARQGGDAGRAHGAGLVRVRHFIREMHGLFHLRSRMGRGTVVCLDFPAVLKLAVRDPRVRAEHVQSSLKEQSYEKVRRPTAA